MLRIRLKEFLLSKGIDKPYPYLRKLGISYNMTKKLLHKKTIRVPIKILSTICEATYCTPNDLFEWIPHNKKPPLPPNHPLQSIYPRLAATISKKLKRMTEAEIKAWEKRMNAEEDKGSML